MRTPKELYGDLRYDMQRLRRIAHSKMTKILDRLLYTTVGWIIYLEERHFVLLPKLLCFFARFIDRIDLKMKGIDPKWMKEFAQYVMEVANE